MRDKPFLDSIEQPHEEQAGQGLRVVGGKAPHACTSHREATMNMHNPPHPGEVLTDWLEDLNLSVTAFAAHIGISRVMLSRILHGHAAVTADTDLRLHEALGTSPGFWLRMQCQHDLWCAGQRAKARPPVARIAP